MTNPSLAVLFASAAALLGQIHSPEERFRMFQDYLKERAAAVTAKNLAGINSLEEWRTLRPGIRRRFLYSLGLDPLPARTPLNARITGVLSRPGYRIEKIVFESMPGLYVTGNLYIPRSGPARMPAIVYLCGHWPGPHGPKVKYQHHGAALARNGFIAFLIDTVEFGEVPGIHHGTHDLGMWYWHSLGYTPAGPEVWNAMRALDYLETRREVDPSRFGVTGMSGGGAITWFAAAADERIKAASAVVGSWTAGAHAAAECVEKNCDCIYFPNAFQLDLPAVGALIAPRPFQLLSAAGDRWFPPSGYRQAYQKTRTIYELWNAGAKLEEFETPGEHDDLPVFLQRAGDWLVRWLRAATDAFRDTPSERETGADLAVLAAPPPNAVNGHVHKTFIPAHSLQRWASRAAWDRRRTELVRDIRSHVLRAFPADPGPFNTTKVAGTWPGRFGYARGFDLEFSSEPGIRVQGQLFLPPRPKPAYPALIVVKGAADVILPVDYDPLLPVFRSHAILVLKPRAVDYPLTNARETAIRMTAALAGSTVESMQLWDLLRSVDYLIKEEQLALDGIAVYGRGHMGALALYAAALDSRITRVIVDHPPASHWQGPPLLNILRITDLPEVAALMAPREIVSLSEMPAGYAYTDAVYRLFGQEKSVRPANDLAQALEVWKHP